jgi:hypothetical protein
MLINGVTSVDIASSAREVNDRGMTWVMRPEYRHQTDSEYFLKY